VSLSAYVLHEGTPIVRALEDAAEHGASVDVLLEGRPFQEAERENEVARANAAVASELRSRGATVRLTDVADEPMHMKAAVVDGRTYLDDRNWTTGERDALITTDGRAVADAVGNVLHGNVSARVVSSTFALDKRAAIRLEAQTIAQASGDRIDVETESFGATEVSVALRERARGGTHVRLIVSPEELRGIGADRERRALASLAAAGVEIRTSAANEKLCVAGTDAWVGSANATFSPGPIIDWGLRSSDSALAAGLEARFQHNWAGGKGLRLERPSLCAANDDMQGPAPEKKLIQRV